MSISFLLSFPSNHTFSKKKKCSTHNTGGMLGAQFWRAGFCLKKYTEQRQWTFLQGVTT